MVNNSDFKEKIKNIENEYNLTHYEVLQRFMFERILERISISKYKNNFKSKFLTNIKLLKPSPIKRSNPIK